MEDANTLTQLLIQYRYALLFPLACIEGPFISLVVGFLVYLGYFNIIPTYILLLLGDIVPDTAYYYLGRLGDRKQLIGKYGARFKMITNNFGHIEHLWTHHGRKTMFFGKLAYGLSIPFLISAGLVRMSLKTFLSYTIPVTMLQYGVILMIGYSLGHSYYLAEAYIRDTYMIIAGILILLIGIYVYISSYARDTLETLDADEKNQTV